jgi:hypothetical protein
LSPNKQRLNIRIKNYIQVILPYQSWQPSLLVRYILSNILNIKVRREGKQNTLNSIQTYEEERCEKGAAKDIEIGQK